MGRWLWTTLLVVLFPLVLLVPPWHRLTCLFSVQLCTDLRDLRGATSDLLDQLGAAPWEGRPDPWIAEQARSAVVCLPPTIDLSKLLEPVTLRKGERNPQIMVTLLF